LVPDLFRHWFVHLFSLSFSPTKTETFCLVFGVPAKTPYQRLLESKISNRKKIELKAIYDSLDPIQLREQIKVKVDRLKRTLK